MKVALKKARKEAENDKLVLLNVAAAQDVIKELHAMEMDKLRKDLLGDVIARQAMALEKKSSDLSAMRRKINLFFGWSNATAQMRSIMKFWRHCGVV